MGKIEKVVKRGIFPWLTFGGGLILGRNWGKVTGKVKKLTKKVKEAKED